MLRLVVTLGLLAGLVSLLRRLLVSMTVFRLVGWIMSLVLVSPLALGRRWYVIVGHLFGLLLLPKVLESLDQVPILGLRAQGIPVLGIVMLNLSGGLPELVPGVLLQFR